MYFFSPKLALIFLKTIFILEYWMWRTYSIKIIFILVGYLPIDMNNGPRMSLTPNGDNVILTYKNSIYSLTQSILYSKPLNVILLRTKLRELSL